MITFSIFNITMGSMILLVWWNILNNYFGLSELVLDRVTMGCIGWIEVVVDNEASGAGETWLEIVFEVELLGEVVIDIRLVFIIVDLFGGIISKEIEEIGMCLKGLDYWKVCICDSWDCIDLKEKVFSSKAMCCDMCIWLFLRFKHL